MSRRLQYRDGIKVPVNGQLEDSDEAFNGLEITFRTGAERQTIAALNRTVPAGAMPDQIMAHGRTLGRTATCACRSAEEPVHDPCHVHPALEASRIAGACRAEQTEE